MLLLIKIGIGEIMSLTEKQKKDIEVLKLTVKNTFSGDFSGHDYMHTIRVLENAIILQSYEGGNLYLIELAALLHDVDDKKLFRETSENKINAVNALISVNADEQLISTVTDIISSVSFSVGKTATTLEAKIVQDADRLDAIGAVGIARCFAYGGCNKRPLYYDKDFMFDRSDECDSGISHFYHKLLKIEERMQTDAGRKLAAGRTEYMKKFLREFKAELNHIK